MKKYVSQTSSTVCWHADKNCLKLTKEPTERGESYIEWHELRPCPQCAEDE